MRHEHKEMEIMGATLESVSPEGLRKFKVTQLVVGGVGISLQWPLSLQLIPQSVKSKEKMFLGIYPD